MNTVQKERKKSDQLLSSFYTFFYKYIHTRRYKNCGILKFLSYEI